MTLCIDLNILLHRTDYQSKEGLCSHVQVSCTVQYITVQYNTVQYSTTQHSTLQYSTVNPIMYIANCALDKM